MPSFRALVCVTALSIAAFVCVIVVFSGSQTGAFKVPVAMCDGIPPLPLSTSEKQRLDKICLAFAPNPQHDLSTRAHLARLSCAFSVGNRHAEAIEQLYSDSSVEHARSGYRYKELRQSEPGEVHPGQVLCALAESRVPIETVVANLDRPVRVSDLVDECAAAFRLDEEVEWRSVALAIYRPKPNAWTNLHGEQVSFDQITQKLLQQTRSRNSDETSCWGTHSFYTLAVFFQVNKCVALWGDRSLQIAVETAFFDASRSLEGSLRADGSWDEFWSLPGISRGTLNSEHRLLVTGHLLEWQAMIPDELRAANRILRSAAEFVIDETEQMSVQKRHEKICACSHGIRALCLGNHDFGHQSHL